MLGKERQDVAVISVRRKGMIEKACEECNWWLAMEEDEKLGNVGECCRYPPSFAEDNLDFADKRPLTLAMDCCGEFKAKNEKKLHS